MRMLFPILAGLVLLAQSAAAAAENPASPEDAPPTGITLRPGDVGAGSLLLRTRQPGRLLPAPTVATDVRMRISGMAARVRVSQRFDNPGDSWTEGIYVFPLPANAAVDRMRLRIGERVIEGRIRERAEARQAYRKAKRTGHRAALVEQERANIFTTSVANIAPGDTVRVEIEYQQTLDFKSGAFSLRFPMAVAPRYIPGTPLLSKETVAEFDGRGWSPDTDQVTDASRITPPVLHPNDGVVNPVTLSVHLDAGFPLAAVESPSHAVDVDEQGAGDVRIRFAEGPVPADRDFVLTWSPRIGVVPRAALFTEEVEGETYALLMVMPPKAPPARGLLRREVIYVIDTSGSMGGASIRQAKRALEFAIGRLRDGDRFNVIEFNSRTRSLFAGPRPASRMSRERALRWVGALDAGGGTEMRPALEAALGTGAEARGVRQIVFLTDGAVGNESALFRLIHTRLGTSRLFTVGIGSAPNAHFMRRAAEFGRGSFTYIGALNEVGEKMQALFAKLESPVMQGVEVRWPDSAGDVEMYPARIPDLYAGEPLVITARLSKPGGGIEIEGVRARETWRVRMPLDGGSDQAGVGVLFARNKIASLMDGASRGADPSLIRQSVIDVALAHHLVSRYTSLVAVDVTPARPPEARSLTRAVPVNLPAGWEYEKVFGPAPGSATPAALKLIAGALMLLLGLGMLWRPRGRRRWV